MMVYCGQTRARGLVRTLAELGIGEMLTPVDSSTPRRRPFAIDNGAFSAWRAGRDFDADRFMRTIDRAHHHGPEFIVTPDIVAGGLRSLEFSMSWVRRLVGVGPLYLVVQDGMTEADIAPVQESFAGLFVGGTLAWKIKTAAEWVRIARRAGMRCHIGRCGTSERVRWARRIRAHSIDSSLPLWSAANLARFTQAIACPQGELAYAGGPTP